MIKKDVKFIVFGTLYKQISDIVSSVKGLDGYNKYKDVKDFVSKAIVEKLEREIKK